MFEYMTAQEAAEKWNVSLRWVQRLCKGNRIEGVMNINRVWLIPKNAEKPADARKNITYTSNNDGFYLSVSDNGCGFSKNILSKATNPYFTEEENHSEHFGLGLYICKILCEHHGGYLKIENCSIGAKVTAFFKSLD